MALKSKIVQNDYFNEGGRQYLNIEFTAAKNDIFLIYEFISFGLDCSYMRPEMF